MRPGKTHDDDALPTPVAAPAGTNGAAAPATPKNHVKGNVNRRVRPLQALAFFVFFFAVSCGFTASQEMIVMTPGFKPLHRGFLTLAHSVAYCAFAGLELARNGWTFSQRTVPLRDYALVAVACFASVFLANSSLTYIDYSTRVMFKCAKPLPTMALSTLLLGRARTKYGWAEYVGAAALGGGLALGIIGGGSSENAPGQPPQSLLAGGALALTSILADTFVSTYEQARIFDTAAAPPPAELILYTYAFAAAGAAAAFFLSDEPKHLYAFMTLEPMIFAKMLTSEVFGFASISCVVRLVQSYGATNAELIKTVRKGITVALAFVVIEGRTLEPAHYKGAALFAGGTALSAYAKHRKRLAAAASSPPAGEGAA